MEVFHQNVIGAMMMSSICTPALAVRGGSIVFIGSIHTRRAFPGASPYAATKAAIQGLTKVLAAELGEQGVRVNCVLPGAVPTEINERAGLGSKAELDARMRLSQEPWTHPPFAVFDKPQLLLKKMWNLKNICLSIVSIQKFFNFYILRIY